MTNATRTSLTIAWHAPNFIGGCPIQSYHILKLNKASGLFEEIDKSLVNNLPALRSHTIIFSESETGS
jgi:hypothetical protein